MPAITRGKAKANAETRSRTSSPGSLSSEEDRTVDMSPTTADTEEGDNTMPPSEGNSRRVKTPPTWALWFDSLQNSPAAGPDATSSAFTHLQRIVWTILYSIVKFILSGSVQAQIFIITFLATLSYFISIWCGNLVANIVTSVLDNYTFARGAITATLESLLHPASLAKAAVSLLTSAQNIYLSSIWTLTEGMFSAGIGIGIFAVLHSTWTKLPPPILTTIGSILALLWYTLLFKIQGQSDYKALDARTQTEFNLLLNLSVISVTVYCLSFLCDLPTGPHKTPPRSRPPRTSPSKDKTFATTHNLSPALMDSPIKNSLRPTQRMRDSYIADFVRLYKTLVLHNGIVFDTNALIGFGDELSKSLLTPKGTLVAQDPAAFVYVFPLGSLKELLDTATNQGKLQLQQWLEKVLYEENYTPTLADAAKALSSLRPPEVSASRFVQQALESIHNRQDIPSIINATSNILNHLLEQGRLLGTIPMTPVNSWDLEDTSFLRQYQTPSAVREAQAVLNVYKEKAPATYTYIINQLLSEGRLADAFDHLSFLHSKHEIPFFLVLLALEQYVRELHRASAVHPTSPQSQIGASSMSPPPRSNPAITKPKNDKQPVALSSNDPCPKDLLYDRLCDRSVTTGKGEIGYGCKYTHPKADLLKTQDAVTFHDREEKSIIASLKRYKLYGGKSKDAPIDPFSTKDEQDIFFTKHKISYKSPTSFRKALTTFIVATVTTAAQAVPDAFLAVSSPTSNAASYPHSLDYTTTDYREIYGTLGTDGNLAPLNQGVSSIAKIQGSYPPQWYDAATELVSCAIADSLLTSHTPIDPLTVTDALTSVCAAMVVDQALSDNTLLEPSTNKLANNTQLINWLVINVNGHYGYAMLDSGASVGQITRSMLASIGPNIGPDMSIEHLSHTTTTHSLGAVHAPAEMVAIRFKICDGKGNWYNRQCDFVVRDEIIPGFGYSALIPLAHSRESAADACVFDTLPYLPFHGEVSKQLPYVGAAALQALPVLVAATIDMNLASVSNNDATINPTLHNTLDTEDIDVTLGMLDSILTWLHLTKSTSQPRQPLSRYHKLHRRLEVVSASLVKNILGPAVPSDEPPTPSNYHDKGATLTYADCNIGSDMPEAIRASCLQMLQDVNDRYGVFGPPAFNNHPPVPIETVPGVLPYDRGTYNADRSLTPEQRLKIREMFQELVQLGFLELYDEATHGPKDALWIHSYLAIEKPNEPGTFRPVVDWRILNQHTVSLDFSTQPTAQMCTQTMAGRMVYTKLDATKYYSCFQLQAGHGIKAAIRSPLGILIPKVMGQGMINSSWYAQQNTDSWLHGFLPWEQTTTPAETPLLAAGYVDDILLSSHLPNGTYEDACKELLIFTQRILARIGEANGRISLKKCEFLVPKVEFIGTVLSRSGRHASPSNLQALVDLPPPTKVDKHGQLIVNHTTLEHVVGFLGWLAPYSPHYHTLTRPLQVALTACRKSKAAIIPWMNDLQTSFDMTKQSIAKNIALAPIDTRYPLVLHSDCSQVAMGGILFTGPPNSLQVVGFFSKTLSPAQQGYDASSRELTGIVTAMKHFAPLIRAHAHRGQRLIVATDHFNLSCWSCFNPNYHSFASRRIRNMYYHIQSAAGATQPILVYRAGKKLQQADALSRNAPAQQSTIEQISEYLSTPVDELVSASHSVQLNNHEQATQAFADNPADFPDDFPSLLQSATPDINDTLYAVQAQRAAQTVLHDMVATQPLPNGFFKPQDLLKEGVTAPTTDTKVSFVGLGAVSLSPEFTPILVIAGSEFPKLLFNHQTTPKARDEFVTLRQNESKSGCKFGTKVVDDHALITATRENGIESYWIPSDDDTHSTQDILLALAHRSAAAHYAGDRTYQQLLDAHVWWQTMREDAHGFSSTCLQCDRLRGPSKGYFNQGTLKQIDTSFFNEVIEIDVLGPLLPDHNNSYIFVIVDHFSGFTLLVPTPSNKESDFKSSLDLWYSIFGWPNLVYSDGGKSLTAKAINDILSVNGVNHAIATPYHAASVGLVERKVGDITRALQKLCALHPSTWCTRLSMIQRAINSGLSASRGVSADQAVFLSPPKSIVRLFTQAETKILGSSAQQLALQASTAIENVTATILKRKSITQQQYEASFAKRNNNTSFDIGQLVWVTYPGTQKLLNDPDNPYQQKTTKLAPRRLLATIISHTPGTNTYGIELFRPDDDKVTKREAHVHQLSPCHAPITTDNAELASRVPGTHAPEAVLAHTGSTLDNIRFVIKWVDLPNEYNSSEPYEFTDLKGKRHSVGETAVVQKYIADNQIDIFGSHDNVSPTPTPAEILSPLPHAPAPAQEDPVDFKPQDIAFSTVFLDYVLILQHLQDKQQYSIKKRDGYIEKAPSHTLYHPAQAIALHLTTASDHDPLDLFRTEDDDDGTSTPPTAPTATLEDPTVAAQFKTQHILPSTPSAPRVTPAPLASIKKAPRKSKGRLIDRVAATDEFLLKRGPLSTPKFKTGDIISHKKKPLQGRITGNGVYMVSLGHGGYVYPILWDGLKYISTEEEERIELPRNRHNTDTLVNAAISLLNDIVNTFKDASTPATSSSSSLLVPPSGHRA